jgi:glutamine amidotransferase
MCIIIAGFGSTTPTDTQLRKACRENPDGFGYGIVWIDDTETYQMEWAKGMNSNATVNGFLQNIKRYGNRVVAWAFHARITTHGLSNEANCHPFPVGGNPSNLLFHNGMLPIRDTKDRSDTRIFAENELPAMGGAPALENTHFLSMLEEWMGYSKFVLLSVDPELDYPLTIVNEGLGFWEGDIWYSNWSSHTTRASSLSTYTPATVTCRTCKQATPDDPEGECTICYSCLECGCDIDTCLCWVPATASVVYSSQLEGK